MKTEIITNIGEKLKVSLKNADEIWIAVALITLDGLNFILKNIKPTCIQNYIIGIDLPTDPKALKKLNDLQLKVNIKVKASIYTAKNNFHPKLYLINTSGTYSSFVGSANCTNGGLNNNVELTTFSLDNINGEQLRKWFDDVNTICLTLSTQYVNEYQKNFQERLQRKKLEEKIVANTKNIINTEYEATLENKKEFVKVLKKYRRSKEYEIIVAERKLNVKTLRKDLDYPNFENLNIDGYFAQWELGHLISIAKPAIQRNIKQLRKSLKYLCDESVDISLRYNQTLNGDFKLEGVGKAFISKVLTIHKPKLYFVKNVKSERALKKYGIEFPRGLSEGEKYKITSSFLNKICIETDIIDLTVLDYFLYEQGSK